MPHWEVDKDVMSGLGWTGTVFAVSLFLAPIPTFHSILKKRSTEQFSPIPYLSALVQCAVWCVYALPFITPNKASPLITNAIGFSLELVYMIIFFIFAVDKKTLCLQLIGVLTFMGGIVVICVTTDGTLRTEILGIIADVLNVIMYAAPLSILGVVLKTKSVEYLPLPLLITAMLNSAAWLAYAIYVWDMYILTANALGVLLGTVQIGIYVAFCGKRHEPMGEYVLLRD